MVYFDSVDKTPCPVRGITVDDDKVKIAFNIDAVADINDLPTTKQIRGGSTAFVIETSELYMLGASGWRKV